MSIARTVQALNFKCLVSCISETYFDNVTVTLFSFALYEGIGGLEV